MLIQSNNFYPVFSEEYVTYLLDEENGQRYLVSKKYKSLDKLVLNTEGKIILENCTGKNTVKDIIKKLSEIYPQVNISRIDTDVNNLLFTCWRIGIITWNGLEEGVLSPYESLFRVNINEYTCTLLTDEKLIDTFSSKDNLKSKPQFTPSFIFSKNTLRDYSFYNIEQYYLISKNNEIHFYYFDEKFLCDTELVSKLVQWATGIYSTFTNKKFNNLEILSLENDSEYRNFISILNFRYLGNLKFEILEEDNTFSDLCIYQKHIRYKNDI